MNRKEIQYYQRSNGSQPFKEWLVELKDQKGVQTILQRIDRVSLGNIGDCRSVGAGVHELRVHFGPGYRVYFGQRGEALIILLCGGDKGTQIKDIATARTYWADYKKRAL